VGAAAPWLSVHGDAGAAGAEDPLAVTDDDGDVEAGADVDALVGDDSPAAFVGDTEAFIERPANKSDILMMLWRGWTLTFPASNDSAKHLSAANLPSLDPL
jgi:hypothetical protein